LKPPLAKQPADQPASAAQAKQQPDGPPTDGIPPLAQLLMLKTLQQELLQRTAELEAQRLQAPRPADKTAKTDPMQAESTAIAVQQGELAELLEQWVRSAAAPSAPTKAEKPGSPP
jgi:hypothetical protein